LPDSAFQLIRQIGPNLPDRRGRLRDLRVSLSTICIHWCWFDKRRLQGCAHTKCFNGLSRIRKV